MLKIATVMLAAAASTAEVVRVALDWTPNTNHAVIHKYILHIWIINAKLKLFYAIEWVYQGFYVGLNKGWFDEAGIDLQMVSPSNDYNTE